MASERIGRPPQEDQERPQEGRACLSSFASFIHAWNCTQDLQTPLLHFHIGRWLEQRLEREDRRLVLNIFRAAGKSTTVGLFCAWLLLRDPNLRILVLAADHELATKMTRNIRQLFERHPLLQHLVPKRREQWAADRFTIARKRSQRDPSILARGIASNITGSRADVVICDDVEVPRTADSAMRRAELRERLSEIEFILVPGGSQLFIGTPHTYHSIYATDRAPGHGEAPTPLQGFERLVLPIVDGDGRSRWPGRFGARHVAEMRARSGPAKFRSQMLLVPTRAEDARLDPEKIAAYDAELRCGSANGEQVMMIGERRMVAATCWWDPAFGRPGRGDASVVASVFIDADNNYYLHRIRYIRVQPRHDLEDQATLQCAAVADLVAALAQPSVTVETNGIGKFLPGLLRKVLKDRGLAASVSEHVATSSKDRRILDVLDPVLEARRLHAHRSVWATPFIEEMREWAPGRQGRDDGLDALSGAMMSHPLRLSSANRQQVRPTWNARQTFMRIVPFDI